MAMKHLNLFFGAVLILVTATGAGFLVAEKFSQNEIGVTTTHSTYIKLDLFTAAFYGAQKKIIPMPQKIVKGIVVNHHLLAPDLIARAILTAAETGTPDTVLLISPNHFGRGRRNILMSAAQWETPYGILEPDQNTIKKISTNNISIDEEPFIKEHGIFNIIPFIKKVFPKSKVIPIIIKESLASADSEYAAKLLYDSLPKNTLVILSADFSHYTTNEIAQSNDKKSISVIEKFDISSVRTLEIDTRAGLEITLYLMKLLGADNWQLLENTNAFQIIGKQPLEGVTSYVTGFFE